MKTSTKQAYVVSFLAKVTCFFSSTAKRNSWGWNAEILIQQTLKSKHINLVFHLFTCQIASIFSLHRHGNYLYFIITSFWPFFLFSSRHFVPTVQENEFKKRFFSHPLVDKSTSLTECFVSDRQTTWSERIFTHEGSKAKRKLLLTVSPKFENIKQVFFLTQRILWKVVFHSKKSFEVIFYPI